MITLELIDITTMKIFTKKFETEYERDKFVRKLKYSKKIKVVNKDYKEDYK